MDKIEVEIQKDKAALSSFLTKIKKNQDERAEDKVYAQVKSNQQQIDFSDADTNYANNFSDWTDWGDRH